MTIPKPDYTASGRDYWTLESTDDGREHHELTLTRADSDKEPRWATLEARHRTINEEEALVLLRRYGRLSSAGLTSQEAQALLPGMAALLVRQLAAHGVEADEDQARAVAANVLQVLLAPAVLMEAK